MSNITEEKEIFEADFEKDRSIHKCESSNDIFHLTDNFIGDVIKVLSKLKTPNILKIIFSFIKSSTIILISGAIFYLIDLIVSPIAKFLVGY